MIQAVQIVPTDETCVISGRPRPGIPTLRLEYGWILEEPSAWLRYLVVGRRMPLTSVGEYAKILREAIRRLMDAGRFRFDPSGMKIHIDMDDGFLEEWRDEMEAKGRKAGHINRNMSTVFHCVLWCQENGYMRKLVGVASDGMKLLPISAIEKPIKDRSGRQIVLKVWYGLLHKTHIADRHTPTSAEIEDLHVKTASFRHAIRNSLIMSWAEETGLRRLELLSILISDIPALDTIMALQTTGGTYSLTVRNGKGGKVRSVPVSPHLLRMTHEYIFMERQDIVDRYDGRKVVPDTVFISDQGAELHPNSVSNLMNVIFAEAKVRDASLHRLRAVFLTRVVERFMDHVDERGLPVGDTTVLLRAAQYAGHSNISSLKPYLNKLKQARLDHGFSTLAELEQHKRLLLRDIAMLQAQRERFGGRTIR